jgi:hypothetical protein
MGFRVHAFFNDGYFFVTCRYTREFFDRTLLGSAAPLYDDTLKLPYIDYVQRYGKTK